MARKQVTVRKGRARPADEAKVEVDVEVTEDAPVVAKPAMGVEMWLILITFAGLMAAFLMIQVRLHSAFGKGWPF